MQPACSASARRAKRDATRAHSQNRGETDPHPHQLSITRRAMRASLSEAGRAAACRRASEPRARISLVGGGAPIAMNTPRASHQQQQAARLSLMRVPACADCYCLRCDVRGSCRRAESIAIPAGTGGRAARSVWERCCDSLSHARERHGPPASSPGYKRRRPPPLPSVYRQTHTRAHTAQCSAKLTWITTRILLAPSQHTPHTHTHHVARFGAAAHLPHLPIQKGELKF